MARNARQTAQYSGTLNIVEVTTTGTYTQLTTPIANPRFLTIRARGEVRIAHSASPGTNYFTIAAGGSYSWELEGNQFAASANTGIFYAQSSSGEVFEAMWWG